MSHRRRTRHPQLRRWGVGGVVVLVIAAAVGYGLDWASRIGAQAVVERSIARGQPQVKGVDVDVTGAFFLPQVVRSHYDHVRVTLTGLEANGLRIQEIDADLYDVHVPVARVVRQTVAVIPIDHTHEHALITYPALNDFLAAQGSPVTVSNGSGGELRLHAHFTALGRDMTVSADATVKAIAGFLEVQPTKLDTGTGVVDQATTALLRVRLAFEIPTSPLPFGQQVQSIRATPGGVVVIATGQDVMIYPEATSGQLGT
jgi:hypothetical protein